MLQELSTTPENFYNLGSGSNPIKGAINIDIKDIPEVDVCLSKIDGDYIYTSTRRAKNLICLNPYKYYIHEHDVLKYLNKNSYIILTGSPSNKYFNKYYNDANNEYFVTIYKGPYTHIDQLGKPHSSNGQALDITRHKMLILNKVS